MSEGVDVRVAIRSASRVGEGPVWHGDRLHWVDILAGDVHVSDLDGGISSTVRVPTWVGAAVPMVGGGYVAATRDGFATIIDGALDTVSPFLPAGIRMNDAKCDPVGRLWAGSCAEDFAPGAGALHRLDPDWSHRTVLDGLTQPNGLGWSPDGSTMYLVDTQDLAVYAYEFDVADGALGDRRTLVRFDRERDGYPDGLAVDADGCLWIAMWAGGAVVQVSPEGDVLRRIAMPVSQPTSCAFVGGSLDDLCVTSASEGLTITEDSLDGSVFLISGVAAGTPVATFAGSRC